MLDNLAPARRRLVVAVALLVALAVVVAVAVAVLGRDDPVVPVAQDELGPVLLLPGYGGAAGGLEPLAAALQARGRTAEIIEPPGDGRGDLREHADLVAQAARRAVAEGAPSVDVVGYSAGGVVARYFVAELGGDALTRRVLTLSSPHHGTDLAETAGSLGSGTCPEACQQLRPDSDLLTDLGRGDETPAGPLWAALWTTGDSTVVPPTSGRLEGAVDFAVQDVCPALVLDHAAVPADPAVVAMALAELGAAPPAVPRAEVCSA